MPPWYKRTLSSDEALGRANTHLDNARNTKDRRRAQKLCDEAQEALGRMDISKSIKDRDNIVAAYREHGKLLEKLGLGDEAQTSYNKADELITMVRTVTASPPHVDTTPASTPPLSVASSSAPSSTSAPACTTALPTIFTKDYPQPVIQFALPGPDERLVSTRQLAFCLAVLQTPPSTLDNLNPSVRIWLKATEVNKDEKDRLGSLATDLIRALARDELKDRKAISEVLCLASVLEKGDFRSLLLMFINIIKDSLLLDVQSLDGLAHLIQSASPGYLDADDLVKILELLSTRLQETFQQSPQHIYDLTLTVSHVLDVMADCNIQGLDRFKLHEPLLSYLERLKADKDPYIVYQAAYAFQALLCVPDDEEPWQAALRRSGAVIKGIGGLASAVKGLNITEFINGLSTIQEGFQGASQIFGLVQDAYNGVTALNESGQGLLESLKNGLSFSHKRAWYAALRGADSLIQNGEMTKFKTLVCDAPCRRDLAFQWGVCQRLGYLAADPGKDDGTRKDAIAFLGEIYWNDEEWGQEPRIKQCILDILLQLSQLPGHDKKGSMCIAAEEILRALETVGDEKKQGIYLACVQSGSRSHTWKGSLPLPDSSSLIDQVQNKPSVEPALRKYQHRRLQEQEHRHAVYIPPQAKATRESSDDDLFDLTIKANEFITDDGNARVLLILGDSGAGKSTFNLEFEKNLWKTYNTDKKWIPIFVTLPAIDKPEKDLIAKRLRDYDFTEDQIRELKYYHQFVLICDGYDECQKKDNLYNDNRLNQPGEWKVKMIVSCRSEFLGSDYRILFQPGNRNDRRGATQLQEAVVAPFSVSKINDYIQSYVTKYSFDGDTIWKAGDYETAIKAIPNLQELVRNPFMLSLALEVLPRLVELSSNVTSSRISRVTLYDEFVEQWVERGQIRLTERSLTGDDHAAFEILLEDGFTRNALEYVKDLAVAIFDKQDGRPVVEYSPIRDKTSWKTAFFGHGDGKNLLRETCPLVRTGNQHRFIHRSVMEYGLARAIFDPNPSGTGDQSLVEQLDVQHRKNLGGLSEYAQSESPLFRRNFVNEPSIMNFLSERVQQSLEFKEQLFKFINLSKEDMRFSQAAANAITILVRAGIRFNGADLRGVRIPGANLSGGDFDSAQLQDADLSNTIFRNSWLRRTDLSNSQMEGVAFGQYPFLEFRETVLCCAFSPDGNRFAVSIDNGTALAYDTSSWDRVTYQDTNPSKDGPRQLWDTHRENLAAYYGAPPNLVLSVVYSPSCQQIASGGSDGAVRLWNAQTGELVSTLSGHTGDVNSVVYSPTGDQIASGGSDGDVQLWDVKSDKPTFTFIGHSGKVESVAYSFCGAHIASGSHDDTARLWDTRTGDLTSVLRGHTSTVYSVAFSPRGQHIASCSDDGVRLWSIKTGDLVSTLNGDPSPVFSLAFSPGGHQIASGSEDRKVRLWDVQTGELLSTLSGHTSNITSLTYSPTGQHLASGSLDHTVRLWDAQTGELSFTLSGHTSTVLTVACSRDGQRVASGGGDDTVRLWDAHSGELVLSLSGHTNTVYSVAISPNSYQIASGSGDRTIRLWDGRTGEHSSSLIGHDAAVIPVVYSPNGQQIASGGWDATVRLWDAQSGELLSTLCGHTGAVFSAAYSPSGHQIVSGSSDRTVRLWDTQTTEPVSIFYGHTGAVTSVSYSCNGRQIATASSDATVRLWDAQTGGSVFISSGHTDIVNCVAISLCGQYVASASDDSTVRLWDIGGHCLLIVDDFEDSVRKVAWNPSLDGSYLVTACQDNSVRSWKIVQGVDGIQMVLRWRSSPDALVLSNSKIEGVQGLSEINTRLLLQRRAVGKPAAP